MPGDFIAGLLQTTPMRGARQPAARTVPIVVGEAVGESHHENARTQTKGPIIPIEHSVQGRPLQAQSAISQKEETLRLAERLDDFAKSMERELDFEVDEESGRTIITVINSDTQEIVRQIPPKEVLALLERIGRVHKDADMGRGVLINKKA
jgi:flagellar protein FlaG